MLAAVRTTLLLGLLAAIVTMPFASSESAFDHDEAFQSWDENRDGQISKQEYYQLLKRSDPQGWTEENLKQATENMFMADVDKNQDGIITMEEWRANIQPGHEDEL